MFVMSKYILPILVAVFIFSYVVFVFTRSSSNTLIVQVSTPDFHMPLAEAQELAQKLTEYSKHYTYELTEYNQNAKLRVVSVFVKGGIDTISDASRLMLGPWHLPFYPPGALNEITEGDQSILCHNTVREWMEPENYSKPNTLMWQYFIFATTADYVSVASVSTFEVVIVKNNITTRSDAFRLEKLPTELVIQVSPQLYVEFNSIKFYTPSTIIAYTIYKGDKAVIELNNMTWNNIYPELYARIRVNIPSDNIDELLGG